MPESLLYAAAKYLKDQPVLNTVNFKPVRIARKKVSGTVYY